ncbi:MAG: c-type cytochrome [Proteobacteria bacterium]|nr:c-type cytochrome [Pseudomonadota bacterium]MDA0846619.1 c-type cytochrome [Pseudomonadota bacterium]
MRQLVLAASLMALAGAAQASADLTKKYNCVACHAEASRKVGPAYKDVAKKYASQSDAVDYLTKKIKTGGAGVWGRVPMPAYPQLSDADSKAMATYIMALK